MRVMLGVLLLTAVQASAAIEYDFHQITHSDLENVPPTDFTGRAVIDGERSRVEFVSGIGYPAGTYVISTNGSRTLTFVDPSKKSFVDVNASSAVSALASVKLAISNKKVDLTQMDDHPIIAGLPTDHFRLSLSYDITLNLGSLSLTQTVHTIEDKFVTSAFGDVASMYIASGALKTGNSEIDDLVDIENSRVKGFPLKQVTMTSTTNNGAQVANSPLKVSRTITTTRETTVTSVQPKASVPMALFMVPVGFHKADTTKDDTNKTPLHVLSMEPAAQTQTTTTPPANQ